MSIEQDPKEAVAPLSPPPDPTPPPVVEGTKVEAAPSEPVKPPHPLEPGGVRFQQIYARAKGAEEELAEERELRIRAEAERDILKSGVVTPTTAQPEREYTNAELTAMVIQGQATQDQVDEYKEQRLEKKIAGKLRAELDARQRDAGRADRLTVEFDSYTKAIPNIGVLDSVERKQVDAEYSWLLSIHGIDPMKLTAVEKQSLALNAVRNVFGPVTSISQRVALPSGEVHMGMIGGQPPVRKPNPDQAILDGLTPDQVTHYNKMMRAGRYPKGWADVVEELKYVPPKVTSGMVRR